MDNISAIQNSPELISLDKINEAGFDLDADQRDDETLAVLNNNNAFVINDIVFPPPTTAFLSILETIESPFINGDIENMKSSDVINALYFLYHREKAVKATMWLKLEQTSRKSPDYYEKYIQNISKVLNLSPFGEEILAFGESLGVFDWIDSAVKIQQYLGHCMSGFDSIPEDSDNVKKNETSPVNG